MLMALQLRYVSVSSAGNTITAEAFFSDVAALFASAGVKLKKLGWQGSVLRTAAQTVGGIAVGLSLGALLFNKSLREFTVTNAMHRSWEVRSSDGEQLVAIANEILSALKIIAPNHKVVTARREG
jgi:hypothetical protein